MEKKKKEILELARKINNEKFDVEIIDDDLIKIDWNLQDARLGWVWPNYVDVDPYAWQCRVTIRFEPTYYTTKLIYEIHDCPENWANGLPVTDTEDIEQIRLSVKDIAYTTSWPEIPFSKWEIVRQEEISRGAAVYGYPQLLERRDLTLVEVEKAHACQYGVYYATNRSINTSRAGAARDILLIDREKGEELISLSTKEFDSIVRSFLEY